MKTYEITKEQIRELLGFIDKFEEKGWDENIKKIEDKLNEWFYLVVKTHIVKMYVII